MARGKYERTVEWREKMSKELKGRKLTEKWKRNIGEANKRLGKRPPTGFGKNNPFYGKHHTEETKRKMSEKHRNISVETRGKMRKAKLGKKQSLETRRKRSETQRGEKSYRWKGGIYGTERHRKMTQYEYRHWRKSVFERDNYTCRICGRRGCFLNAHHINSWNDYPQYRYDIKNGITICIEHHKLFEKMRRELRVT